MDDPLTNEEKQTLLRLGASALEGGVRGAALPRLELDTLTPHLRDMAPPS